MSKPFTIPVGQHHEPHTTASVRSAGQREAVQFITRRADFDYAYDNPFTTAHSGSVGPLWFLWNDTRGRLHSVKIGVLGTVLLHVVSGRPTSVRTSPPPSPTPGKAISRA